MNEIGEVHWLALKHWTWILRSFYDWYSEFTRSLFLGYKISLFRQIPSTGTSCFSFSQIVLCQATAILSCTKYLIFHYSLNVEHEKKFQKLKLQRYHNIHLVNTMLQIVLCLEYWFWTCKCEFCFELCIILDCPMYPLEGSSKLTNGNNSKQYYRFFQLYRTWPYSMHTCYGPGIMNSFALHY